jgi:hypothetical protein
MPAKRRYVFLLENVVDRAYSIRKVLCSRVKAGEGKKERCYNRISNFQVAFIRS